MKRFGMVTLVVGLTLAGCGGGDEDSSDSAAAAVTTLGGAVNTSTSDSDAATESPATNPATEAPAATDATAAPKPHSPEAVAAALADAGLCDGPSEYEREAGQMEAAGLVPPTSEWQCRSTVGLVLVQQFPTVGDLHDAAVAVAASGFADNPVLDLGNGLVIDANNGGDTTITIDDESAWLEKAAEAVGGKLVPMKDL